MYDLPNCGDLNISALSGLFSSTTNSYKYLYFLSILEIAKRKNFEIESPVSLQDIVIEMLANAWYPHNYFKLFFGTQDHIANKLDSLQLQITDPILKFRDTDKKLLRKAISSQNIDDTVAYISKYVPYRLIRPFFAEATRGFKDYDVNSAIIALSHNQFDNIKPLYCFNSDKQKDCNAIILHPDWIKYLEKNYIIVRAWASWEWLKYMQQRNPNIPNVVNKLFMPQHRDSLNKQTKYWKNVLTHKEIQCIYSEIQLNPEKIALDHYLPWSFLAHDQLWNLIPTTQSINSSKSNNLPSNKYFPKFVKLQNIGLKISHNNISQSQWLRYIEPFLSDLRINQAEDLLNLEILTNAYEQNFQPLMTLATNQGFSANWTY